MLVSFKQTKFFKFIHNTKIYKIIRKGIGRIHTYIHTYITLKKIYPSIYIKNATRPINENKIVFIEVNATKISDNAELIYNSLKKSSYEIHIHCLLSNATSHRHYKQLCKNMVKDIADAKYIFLTDSSTIFSCLPLRKESIVTQLWHGCGAFKKFGFSSVGTTLCPKGNIISKYPPHNNYTYVTVSSNEVVWAYEEAMNLKKGIVQAIGCSRTDVFFDDEYKKRAYQKLYETIPHAKGKKIILYAPTFRGFIAYAEAPSMLNISLFQESLSDEYILITKYHPFCKELPKISQESANFAIDCTNTMTIENLIYVSDICISDYSSLIFEYSLFERPMIFFAYDLDSYYDQRGFFYDYKSFVPGPIFSKNEEMIDYIQHIDSQFDKTKVVDFKNKFMSACDGHATERILSLVFQK